MTLRQAGAAQLVLSPAIWRQWDSVIAKPLQSARAIFYLQHSCTTPIQTANPRHINSTNTIAPTNNTMPFGAPAPVAPAGLVGSSTNGTNPSCAQNDHCVPSAGNDGVSSLVWSPTANHLVSSNWDGGVRCWEVQESGQQVRALPKAQGED